MRVANHPIRIDDRHERHAPQLEEVYFLAVLQRNSVPGIRQSNKWESLRLPVGCKRRYPIRTHRQHLGAPLLELIILVSQARQLRAAIGSEEAPQERKQDGAAAELGQPDRPPLYVG